MRSRLFLFVSGVFLAESAFFAVVPPLVPRLANEVGMTTTEIGILVAAYPAGLMIAAIPSIALVGRFGVRPTTVLGLAMLVVATLGFAWGPTAILLDAARLLQGMGGAVAWAGALAWLTSQAPKGRKASALGGAVGAALIGMVLGPAIGATASHFGRGPVFSAIAIVLAALAMVGPSGAPVSARGAGSFRAVGRLFRNNHAAIGNGLLAVIGVVNGTVATLVPLLVVRRHGSAAVIAIILASSYLLGAAVNVVFGRLSDRVGRLAPTVAGMLLAAAILPTLPLIGPLAVLAAATVIIGASLSGLWTPTAAMVTDGAEQGPSGQAVAVATLNAAWAAGGAAGAIAVARLADVAGFVPPFALVGGLCAVGGLVAAVAYRRRVEEGQPTEPQRARGS
jgi:predicted MFS family arabinose efflux permease